MNIIHLSLAFALTAAFSLLAHAAPQRGPFNRIVILVDATDSFKQRRFDAIEQAQRLVQQVSSHRPKRWEAADQLVIISLDAIPEVIWKGDASALSKANRGDWVARFKSRADYARCTDVRAAFELALNELEGLPQATGHYLIGFSDLIHEPPLSSPSKCRPPMLPSVLEKDFPWDRLAEVSVAMFWLPPNQKLAWDRAMKENGIVGYRLFTTSESTAAEVELPRAKQREMSAQDREHLLGRFAEGLGSLAKLGLAVVVTLALMTGGVALALRFRNRRVLSGGTPAPRRSAGRRVAGRVPPMSLPGAHGR